MEVLQLLLASKNGLVALTSVSLAVAMLTSSLALLAYKAKQTGQ